VRLRCSNHYRWVVWKLARAELARGPAARGRLLTPAVAEDELRRRYEWEHVRGHRPLLKALLQQDEAPGAAAVLLVASSHPGGGPAGGGGGPAASLELTDGWYWVRAQCDGPLSELVRRGAAAPGAKLRVCCAELAAAGPGEPLAAARAATLRLTANNARPAPPGARLGRQPHRSTLVPLSGVRPSGGVVPQTLVVVLRAYPTLVWCKLPSGVAVWQTERAHAAALARTRGAVAAAEAAAAGEAHEAEVALCRGWLRNGKPGGLAQGEPRTPGRRFFFLWGGERSGDFGGGC
jgi:breast cancer 2 susceptibility protein